MPIAAIIGRVRGDPRQLLWQTPSECDLVPKEEEEEEASMEYPWCDDWVYACVRAQAGRQAISLMPERAEFAIGGGEGTGEPLRSLTHSLRCLLYSLAAPRLAGARARCDAKGLNN